MALAVYAFLIWRGPDAKLYALTNNDEMTKKVRAFLALAGFGFLVCIYRGTESMLFWLPVNITSEGGRITAASVVALIFTLVAGSILIKHILRTPDRRESGIGKRPRRITTPQRNCTARK